MLQFTDVEELIKYIEKDIQSKSYCPVRFINLETMVMWVKVKAALTLRCSESIILSKYCEVDDSTPNLNRLKTYLRKLDKTVILTPLSEHLRINNDIALKTFNDILKMNFTNNDDKSLKVYIPVYRMKSLLKNLEVDSRNEDSIIFLDTDSDPDYSLTIIQDTLNAKVSGNEITGYKNYLVYWEQNPDKPIILHTQNAIHFSNIVFADDVKVIVTAFDLLRFHYKLPDVIKEEWGTVDNWNCFLQHYNESATLDGVLGTMLKTRSFNLSLFENWQTKSETDKWLIWLWAKYKAQSSYLLSVLRQNHSVADFANKIYDSILYLTTTENYQAIYSERLNLIRDMKINPTASFWNKIEQLTGIDKIKCLSCHTEQEQVMIFTTLKDLELNDEIMGLLKIVFSELSYYLADSEFENELLTDYFSQYKKQKALNIVDDNFINLVEELAVEHCAEIWKLKARNVLVNEMYDDDTVVFFADGLGVEYIELLSELLRQKGLYIELRVGYCNIPSTTEENKDFYKDKIHEKNYELDSIKHSNIAYPFNLIKEFIEIKNIADQVAILMADKTQVIIAADHGTSRLAVLTKGETFKVNENAEKYKYGRYCVDPVNDYSHFKGCINKDNYWIFANYNRFSSQGSPSPETHGGATLEECVVPVLSVKKVAPQKKVKEKIIITLLTESVKETPNKPIKIEFALSKQLSNVVAVVSNKRYNCDFDGERYSFNPIIGKDMTYAVKIVCKEIIGEFTYTVIKGISSNLDI